jgi:hypothetical protein
VYSPSKSALISFLSRAYCLSQINRKSFNIRTVSDVIYDYRIGLMTVSGDGADALRTFEHDCYEEKAEL